MASTASPYAGRRASLASMHDKLALVAPEMESVLRLEVFPADIDTDSFGTFAGETPRTLGPFETALAKARAGMTSTGTSIGLASEGAIGTDGFLPLVSDLEIMAIVDEDHGFVLCESAVSTRILARSWVLESGLPTDEELVHAGFPDHGLIVRPAEGDGPITKGIHEMSTLVDAVERCRASGADRVRIESDLRAHHCPSRRPTIREAAQRLAERLAASCPACECPGWGPVSLVRGLECGACGYPTDLAIADVMGCCRCDAQEIVQRECTPADPARCDRCNP